MKSLLKKIKTKYSNLPHRKKIQAVAATVISIVLVLTLPIFAWFVYDRSVGTMVKINAPTKINIGAGNKEGVAMIDLSNIDVEEVLDDGNTPVTEGDYVFCVYGEYLQRYDLQIARTTNIPFDYELYRVDSTNYSNVLDENGITVRPGVESTYNVATFKSITTNKTYFYPYLLSSKVSGGFINKKTGESEDLGDGTVVADGETLHKRNYDSYNNINKYAQPLYWQAKNLPVQGHLVDEGFLDYYVLKIKWAGKGLTNSKETDMIYITARRS